ncbi:MAG: hypothetical protein ACLUO4_05920 [Christensenellales bacterium]
MDDTFSVESYTEYDDLGNVCREWTYKNRGRNAQICRKGLHTRPSAYKQRIHEFVASRGDRQRRPAQTTAYRYDESAGAGLIKQMVTDAGGVSKLFNQLGQTVKQVQKGRNSEKQIVTVCT